MKRGIILTLVMLLILIVLYAISWFSYGLYIKHTITTSLEESSQKSKYFKSEYKAANLRGTPTKIDTHFKNLTFEVNLSDLISDAIKKDMPNAIYGKLTVKVDMGNDVIIRSNIAANKYQIITSEPQHYYININGRSFHLIAKTKAITTIDSSLSLLEGMSDLFQNPQNILALLNRVETYGNGYEILNGDNNEVLIRGDDYTFTYLISTKDDYVSNIRIDSDINNKEFTQEGDKFLTAMAMAIIGLANPSSAAIYGSMIDSAPIDIIDLSVNGKLSSKTSSNFSYDIKGNIESFKFDILSFSKRNEMSRSYGTGGIGVILDNKKLKELIIYNNSKRYFSEKWHQYNVEELNKAVKASEGFIAQMNSKSNEEDPAKLPTKEEANNLIPKLHEMGEIKVDFNLIWQKISENTNSLTLKKADFVFGKHNFALRANVDYDNANNPLNTEIILRLNDYSKFTNSILDYGDRILSAVKNSKMTPPINFSVTDEFNNSIKTTLKALSDDPKDPSNRLSITTRMLKEDKMPRIGTLNFKEATTVVQDNLKTYFNKSTEGKSKKKKPKKITSNNTSP